MTDTPKWYEEAAGFFGQRYLDEYANVLTHERTMHEVAFLIERLGLTKGTRVLDIPCGHGRHAVELAAKGCAVTGVDLNTHFLARAKEAAAARGVELSLEECDMRSFTSTRTFDVALNLFTALGYFEEESDDVTFMRNVHRVLAPGGRFLIDFMNQSRLMRVFQPKAGGRLSDGSLVLEERSYDPLSGTLADTRLRARAHGPIETIETTLRLYTPLELRRMAESVGFVFEDAYGTFDGDPLTLSSPRCILLFAKP